MIDRVGRTKINKEVQMDILWVMLNQIKWLTLLNLTFLAYIKWG